MRDNTSVAMDSLAKKPRTDAFSVHRVDFEEVLNEFEDILSSNSSPQHQGQQLLPGPQHQGHQQLPGPKHQGQQEHPGPQFLVYQQKSASKQQPDPQFLDHQQPPQRKNYPTPLFRGATHSPYSHGGSMQGSSSSNPITIHETPKSAHCSSDFSGQEEIQIVLEQKSSKKIYTLET